MTRSLGADTLAAVIAERAEFCHLLELQFSSGTVRLSTGSQDLSWDSQTWQAVGGLLEFGGVEETGDVRGQGVDVRLSGVDQTVLSTLLTNQFRGRPIKIWRAYLNTTTGEVLGTPLLLFQGLQLSPYTVEEQRGREGGSVKISTRVVGLLGINRVRGIQANLVGHQHYFNGDTFFRHTSSLANVKVYWGTNVATVGGGGGGRAGAGGGTVTLRGGRPSSPYTQ